MSAFTEIKFASGRVTLFAVAKIFGIIEEDIVNLLRNAGYDVHNIPFTKLNDGHLEVLSKAYVKAVKSYYNSTSKNLKNLSKDDIEDSRIFFSRFIKRSMFFYFEADPKDQVFKKKLDDHLIIDFFFELIDKIEFRESITGVNNLFDHNFSEDVFNRVRYRIKIDVKSKFILKDLRSSIHSILVCFHYYIFSDDEDNTIEASNRTRFSGKDFFAGEALKLFKFLKFSPKCETKILSI